MKKETKIQGIVLLGVLSFILGGCETGIQNKQATQSIGSGIVNKATTYSKPHTPKASEIKKIFSKSGTPGYYIQVGYFKDKKPSSEFINRMKYSQLPYTLLKKYEDGKSRYHALVGPYRSYNEANEIKTSAREYVASNAFIVKVARP